MVMLFAVCATEVDTSRHVSRHVFGSLGLVSVSQLQSFVSVSVLEHCVSNPGRDIAAMRAKLTDVVSVS